MEKRDLPPRKTRRLSVAFSDGKEQQSGTSSNFSLKGLFIRTRKAFNPGTSLKMVIEVDEHQKIDLTGIVVWATRTGNIDFKNGMGIKLTSVPQAYEDYVKGLN